MYYISNTICENGHFSCNLKIKSGHPTKPNPPVEGGKIRLKIIGKKGVSKNLNRSKLFFSDKFPNRSMCWSKILHFSDF